MKVTCEISESTLEIPKEDQFLIVESDFGRDVKLRFKGGTVVVNSDALKKAIDNCTNV